MTAARFLLDTNTASFIIRGKPIVVVERLGTLHTSETAISTVTEAELLFGLARKPGASVLQESARRFLAKVARLPWDSAAARQYAQLRWAQESSGRSLSELDTMIAAHAVAENLVLVTNDKAFQQVAGIRLEDWTKA